MTEKLQKIKEALEAIKEELDYDCTNWRDVADIRLSFEQSLTHLQKYILEAAEQERQDGWREPQDGDIGIDEAERLYKFLFNKWVAQGKSSEPVYPVKIIARRINGEYLPTPPEEKPND